MKLIKWLFWLVLFLVVIAAGGAIFLVTKVNPNDFKPQISQQVESLTGRKLELAGELSWRFYPWVGVTVNDFALSNRAGFEPENMLQAAQVDVQIKLIPLISSQIEIGKVSLKSPIVNLSVNDKGETNWDDLIQEGPASSMPGQAEQEAGAILGGLVIQGVDISEGEISWNDHLTDQHYQLSGFNISTGTIKQGVPVKFNLNTRASGSALPADASAEIDGILSLNQTMDEVKLDGLVLQADMGEMSANVKLASLHFSLAASQLMITDMNIVGSDSATSGQLKINRLDFALESGLLDVDRIDGQVSMDPLQAEVAVNALHFALDSQKATIAGLAYSGKYDVYPFEGELAGVDFDVNSNTLTVASHAVKSQYNELPLQVSGSLLELDINQQSLRVPELLILLDEVRFDARVEASQILGDVQASGTLKSSQFNPRPLLEKLEIDALSDMPDQAVQSVGIKANFSGGLLSAEITNLDLMLDSSSLTGELSIVNFENPAYRFDLTLDQINVDDYLSESNQAVAEQAGPGAAVVLPFAELQGLDVDGTIRIGQLRMLDLLTEDVLVEVNAAADKIAISPLKARAYGGETENFLVYDLSGEQPAIEISSNLSGLNLGPFLRAMQITDRFDGVGSVTADIDTEGLDIDAAIAGLNGTIDLNLRDGAIRGIDIQKSLIEAEAAIRKLSGQEPGTSAELGDKTEFSEFSGDIQINQGVMTISKVNLKAPAIRVSGGGTVNLKTEQLDLKLDVSIVGSLEGQGGASLDKLKGQTIPIKISGPLDSPKVLPDFKKILQGELESKLSEKYLGGEKGSGESLNDALKRKLSEKLTGNVVPVVPVVPAATTGSTSSTPSSNADIFGESDAPATTGSNDDIFGESKAPEKEQPAPKPEKLEDQLKEKLKGSLLKGLFGG